MLAGDLDQELHYAAGAGQVATQDMQAPVIVSNALLLLQKHLSHEAQTNLSIRVPYMTCVSLRKARKPHQRAA